MIQEIRNDLKVQFKLMKIWEVQFKLMKILEKKMRLQLNQIKKVEEYNQLSAEVDKVSQSMALIETAIWILR